jgi:hypothetical protein
MVASSPGHDVAEVDGIEPVRHSFEHDGGITFVDCFLVLRLGGALFDDNAGEQLVAEANLQIEQRCARGYRKRVDRLDVGRRRIAIVLLHCELEQQSVDPAPGGDAQKRHDRTRDRLQHRCFVAHDLFL